MNGSGPAEAPRTARRGRGGPAFGPSPELRVGGYEVTAVSNGPDGLEKLRGARFDAVVMDVMLPGMDGFTVVETIRLEERHPGPVLDR